MTNKELKKLMDKTYKYACLHHEFLKQLEDEYENRYGCNPSDVDDDFFIDTFIYASGPKCTIKQMDENAKLHS